MFEDLFFIIKTYGPDENLLLITAILSDYAWLIIFESKYDVIPRLFYLRLPYSCSESNDLGTGC